MSSRWLRVLAELMNGNIHDVTSVSDVFGLFTPTS